MPNRIVRDYTDSEAVNNLTPMAERFFLRLIVKVDDYARLYAKPKLLRASLFPLAEDGKDTEEDINMWLIECQSSGLITVYKIEQKWFLQIKNFGQRLRQKKEKYPPPADNCQSYDGHMTVISPHKPPENEHDGHMTVNGRLEREEKRRETEVETEVETEERSRKSPLPEGLIWNIEEDLLKDQMLFEKILMATRKTMALARDSLRKYHLFLEEKEQYPKARKAAYAGFEKWLMNEKKQNDATTTGKESAAERNSRGATELLERLRKNIESAAG